MHDKNNQLLRLMTLLSPVFPIGAFSYSHGIEQAVHEGFIKNAKAVEDWLLALLTNGSAFNDVIFLSQAWRNSFDEDKILEINSLALALSAGKQREMESKNQGQAFIQAAKNIIDLDLNNEELAYPIAVGLVSAKMQLDLLPSLHAYLHGFVSNLVQAAVRLVPLGQNKAVQITANLEKTIMQIAQNGHVMDLTQLGSSCVMADILSMRHETLYSRIFRS